MSSKLDRWKKLSATSSGGDSNKSKVNENKKAILTDLSTIPVEEENNTKQEEVKNKSSRDKEKVGVKSRSNVSTPKVEVKDSVESSRSRKADEPDGFIFKVNSNVREMIESKVTKEMTHKKTSFLISLTNLAKLRNFDKAHGGRIQGEFINNLLEEAFNELEQDPKWKKILNANLDRTITELSRRR